MHLTKHPLICFLIGFPVLLSFTAARGEGPAWRSGGASAPSADTNKKSEKVQIKQVIDNQDSLDGKDVSVEGFFRGWKGGCPSSYMLTRSDWILEDETGCIYITGRIPDSVSPMKPQGEHILVKGRVLMNEKGKSIIKVNEPIRFLTP